MTLEEQLRESLSDDKPTIEEGQNDTPEAGNQDLNPQEEEGHKAVYETDKRKDTIAAVGIRGNSKYLGSRFF